MATSYPDGSLPPTQISSASKSRVQSLVSDAIASGARLVFGNPSSEPEPESMESTTGIRMMPTIVTEAKESTGIWQDEIFGLAVACMVPSEEDAIEVTNNTECDLFATIFIENLRKGLNIAKKLRAG